ncbi:hypothetical protein C0Q70_03417 [Pomacea canaliculata]|uniref:UDP-N-acetylglucosamine transferase subunit ALG13 n=1 Tax=Pomacea canaliculata TaxID=400727 RepID=A0A2T7PSM0_POMCA|nr:hypothetical protein C0Q70_03417 [Pomacea canaliculata]
MVQEKITLRSKPSFDETFILSSSQMMEKNVFVTVGTTEFVELIKTATSDDILKVLRNLGFTKVLLQIGRGSFEPESRCASPKTLPWNTTDIRKKSVMTYTQLIL